LTKYNVKVYLKSRRFIFLFQPYAIFDSLKNESERFIIEKARFAQLNR